MYDYNYPNYEPFICATDYKWVFIVCSTNKGLHVPDIGAVENKMHLILII